MSHRCATNAPAPAPRLGGERGAGTVLVLMVIALTVTAFMVAAVMVSGQSARRQAAAAADLAALAAAVQLSQGPDAACAAAETVARANGAQLHECSVHGVEVEVLVRVAVAGAGATWLPAQERRARAGPG
ncbi:flp pilus-assembly TadE/G-like family protein [Phytoactinopolyspora alkaliphila]|uniref:Flp pilus-assembly TadE/G-like family protein n=1 Tax=Phytoactinopolyspora alkaliphila TaxID=1783498 RepID=A0A6N9YLF3_9ACTN|nr:flp pilus-assembly TadE/G-like family protein [Phytoactinopolyspora alkaliphila]